MITVSDNDITYDLAIRGGFERFSDRNTVHYNHPPVSEPIYAMSYVSRLFFHAFGYDISNPVESISKQEFEKTSKKHIEDIVHRFDSLSVASEFKTIFVLLPMREELKTGYWV